VKLGSGQEPFGRCDWGWQLRVGSRVGHVHILFLIKSVFNNKPEHERGDASMRPMSFTFKS
jgi:hypothetical protein